MVAMVEGAIASAILEADVDRAIREHGERAYPEEACGFLLGPLPEGGRRHVVAAVAAENARQGDRGHRFVIPADEVRRMEASLTGTGREILGYYHSHPDHPARPSEYDRDRAWPWYLYLVLAVHQGRAAALNAFELTAEGREFEARALTVPAGTSSAGRKEP